MGNSLIKKLNGYHKAPRKRFLLLLNGVLNQKELLLYEFGIAIADWDTDHTDAYGTFYATNLQIAQILGVKSDTTVGRIKQSLIDKGYFKKIDKRIWVRDFNEWQLRKYNPAVIEPQPAKTHEENAELHEEPAKLKSIQPETHEYSLGSFKGELRVTRTTEEYQRIWEESFNCSPTFTPDDMRWIDLNVYESSRIPS